MEPGKTQDKKKLKLSISPGNTHYYIPYCDDNLRPYVGKLFATLEEGIKFYEVYADACGFEVRNGTFTQASDISNTIVWKYMLCTRQGFKDVSVSSGSTNPSAETVSDTNVITSSSTDPSGETTSDTNVNKRRRTSNRCGCIAKMVLRYAGHDGYVVKIFEERHTHIMIDDSQKHFAKSNKKLTAFHQDFIMNCIRANIGTSKSYKVYKEFVGSYAKIGATIVDFKNFNRDLNSFMIGCDAQMVIDNLFRKKERCNAFCFEYDVDDQHQLRKLFWCDHIVRKSFSYFGDVVFADATYKSNRYDMVFVPFTGIDNNKKSITFAFGLLLKEDVESYVWLFENFKCAMRHEPFVFLSDQDVAVKIAVERVFEKVVHHFCMWHIMFKVPTKVKQNVYENVEFRHKFNSLVWSNEINRHEFEET